MSTAKPSAAPKPSSTRKATTRRKPQSRSTASTKTRRTTRRSEDKLPSIPNHAEISREAYLIWQREGCPGGRELSHWLQAEQRLSAATGLA